MTGFTVTAVSGLAHQVRTWSAVTTWRWFSTRARSQAARSVAGEAASERWT